MVIKYYNLLFSLLFLNFSFFTKGAKVYTKSGSISGIEMKTSRNKTIYAFLGVPYAKPPVNELRFKEPEPINWSGAKQTTNFSSRCLQLTYSKNMESIIGSEDCLYLNIFTRSLHDLIKSEVIVYIHGGTFMTGGSDMFTPEYILDHHKIVFVSFNYRLGPFGFLSTGSKVVPGNNGLKDQALVLEWVRNNIESFGGDNMKITLAGSAAGAASVHLHYFARNSKGTFAKGISMGGSAFCPWVITENARSKAKILGNSLGCPTDNAKKLVTCLRQIDGEKILLKVKDLFFAWEFSPFTPFGPVVEVKNPSQFLTENPYEILVSDEHFKDVPWIAGLNSEEGLHPGAAFVTDEERLMELDENWEIIAPHILDYNHTVTPEDLSDVNSDIRMRYFEDDKISKTTRQSLIDLLSDRLFAVDVERAALLQASTTVAPVYMYKFAYKGKYSMSNNHCDCSERLGVVQGDDLMYILKTNGISPMETSSDREMSKRMINIWISFAKKNIPSIVPGKNESDWKAVPSHAMGHGNFTYLHIKSSTDMKMVSVEDMNNRHFWDSLPIKELWNIKHMFPRQLPDEL